MLKLPLQKAGEKTVKLSLSLNKGAKFRILLRWESDQDLDAHALMAANDGTRATVADIAHVLSTYNSKQTNKDGALETNSDGSFSTPCGTLTHSGDSIPARGSKNPANETITVDGARAPEGINEIPIFITIHKAALTRKTFAQVTKASITIEDDGGAVLGAYELTGEFAKFNAVQMGSLLLGQNGWEYAAVGNGINGDFNSILTNYS